MIGVKKKGCSQCFEALGCSKRRPTARKSVRRNCSGVVRVPRLLELRKKVVHHTGAVGRCLRIAVTIN